MFMFSQKVFIPHHASVLFECVDWDPGSIAIIDQLNYLNLPKVSMIMSPKWWNTHHINQFSLNTKQRNNNKKRNFIELISSSPQYLILPSYTPLNNMLVMHQNLNHLLQTFPHMVPMIPPPPPFSQTLQS